MLGWLKKTKELKSCIEYRFLLIHATYASTSIIHLSTWFKWMEKYIDGWLLEIYIFLFLQNPPKSLLFVRTPRRLIFAKPLCPRKTNMDAETKKCVGVPFWVLFGFCYSFRVHFKLQFPGSKKKKHFSNPASKRCHLEWCLEMPAAVVTKYKTWRNKKHKDDVHSLKLTASSPLKIGLLPQKGNEWSSSNHPSSGENSLLVSVLEVLHLGILLAAWFFLTIRIFWTNKVNGNASAKINPRLLDVSHVSITTDWSYGRGNEGWTYLILSENAFSLEDWWGFQQIYMKACLKYTQVHSSAMWLALDM